MRRLFLLSASFLLACSSADFTVAADESLDVAADGGESDAAETALETSDDSGSDSATDTGDSSAIDAPVDTLDASDTRVADTSDAGGATDTGTDTAKDASPELCEPLPTKDAPHCGVGETCAVDAAHKSYCRTVNTVATAEMTCAFDTDCNVNAVCFYIAGASAGRCMLFCRSDADCCSGGPCSTGFNCKKTPILYTSPVTGSTYGTCRT